MEKITKIQIENRSKWTISECVKHIAHLMDTEAAFIVGSRDKGCTFRFRDGVNIGISPICKAFPEDTLDAPLIAEIIAQGPIMRRLLDELTRLGAGMEALIRLKRIQAQANLISLKFAEAQKEIGKQ